MRACPAASAVAWTMQLRIPVLLGLAALLVLPVAVTGLHSVDGGFTTDTGNRSFTVQIATPIWWDHTQVRGVPTGLTEQNHMFEIDRNEADVLVTAETFPRNSPDTPKVCAPATTPAVFPPVAGTAILHPINCVKENGHTVQIHYFPWTNEPTDPDHVLSPTPGTPTATTVWRVDAVPTSYKTAVLPANGHWQVWIDPAISPGEYTVVYRATSAKPFYFDYLGTRGCVFYFNVGGQTDTSLLGCPQGYV